MKFFLVLIGFVFILSGCSSSLEMDIFNNIAEIREFMLFDRDDEACVSMICGHRESEYKLNGFATDLIEFGVVTVRMFTEISGDMEMDYVLFVGTEKFDGVMSKNPFDGTFVIDIHKVVDCNANVVLQLKLGEWERSYKLKSINNGWGIESKDCVRILINQYKNELKSLYDKKDWCAEVYIKIIDESDEYVSNFYFYVSVLGRGGETASMVISPITGDILASNSNIKESA